MAKRFWLILGTAVLVTAGAWSNPINQVSPGSLTGTGLVTFDDVAGGASPGVNDDTIFVSGNVAFGERFVGQTLSYIGDNDKLGGTPSGGGLTLMTGLPGQNLNIFYYTTSQVLDGLGPLGFPNGDAIGEGAIALKFGKLQSEFGFDLVGGDGGTATIDFFNATGGLIDEIVVSGLSDQSYAFARDGGVEDIAGISIWNDDAGGIGFDTLRYNVEGGDPLPGGGSSGNPGVPEPFSLSLLMAGLVGAFAMRRRQAR